MLKPLEHIYHAYCNPESADQIEVIFLQDFRWSPEVICWKYLRFFWRRDL